MRDLIEYLKQSSLTIGLLILFLISICGHTLTGFDSYNQERAEHHLQPLEAVSDYIMTGHFISSVFENMESEFLQMAFFVYLTVFLYQIGSSESNPLPWQKSSKQISDDKAEFQYSLDRRRQFPALWRLYEHSLGTALFLLFIISFLLHGYGSWLMTNDQRSWLGKPPIHISEIILESDFWFESFQNWQSEFFSIAVIVVLSIFLRQKGSSQSKRMNAKSLSTGEE